MPYTIHSIHTIGPLLKTQCMTCYCVTHEATVLSIGSFRVGAERNLIGSGLLYLFTRDGDCLLGYFSGRLEFRGAYYYSLPDDSSSFLLGS